MSEPTGEVPRHESLSAEQLQEQFVRRRRPVILTRMTDDWPARKRWSLDYLEERFGDVRVTAGRTQEGRLLVSDDSGIPQLELPFRDFLAMLRRGQPDLYLLSPVEERLPALLDDVVAPEPQRSAPWRSTRLWLGPEGACSPLHRDFPENLFVQMIGRKRVTLIDRRYRREVYPRPPWSSAPNFTRVDPERPDDPRFPRFASVPKLTCVVGPGEVLYIPRLWWHHVRSLDTTLSINLWWAEGAHAWLSRLLQQYARVRGLRK
jgi:hypothetical protein